MYKALLEPLLKLNFFVEILSLSLAGYSFPTYFSHVFSILVTKFYVHFRKGVFIVLNALLGLA